MDGPTGLHSQLWDGLCVNFVLREDAAEEEERNRFWLAHDKIHSTSEFHHDPCTSRHPCFLPSILRAVVWTYCKTYKQSHSRTVWRRQAKTWHWKFTRILYFRDESMCAIPATIASTFDTADHFISREAMTSKKIPILSSYCWLGIGDLKNDRTINEKLNGNWSKKNSVNEMNEMKRERKPAYK